MAQTAEEILEQVRALPERERLRLVERIVHDVVEQSASGAASGELGIDDSPWPDMTDDEYEGFQRAMKEARAMPLRTPK
jgi:hypothetical protein